MDLSRMAWSSNKSAHELIDIYMDTRRDENYCHAQAVVYAVRQM